MKSSRKRSNKSYFDGISFEEPARVAKITFTFFLSISDTSVWNSSDEAIKTWSKHTRQQSLSINWPPTLPYCHSTWHRTVHSIHTILTILFFSPYSFPPTQSSGSCFLFHCGTSDDFRCKFTTHSNFTSGVLTVTRIELESPPSPTTTTTTVAPKKPKLSQNELELVNLKRPSSSYHLWVESFVDTDKMYPRLSWEKRDTKHFPFHLHFLHLT